MPSVLLFLIMLTSLFSHAQRVVGNGGGLSEMQAIYFNEKLDSFLNLCIKSSNPCSLNSSRQNSLSMVLKNHKLDVAKIKLHFSSDLISAFETERNPGSDITFNSKKLYKSEGVPADSSYIVGLVLAARWTQYETDESLSTLIQQSIALMSKMSIQKQSEQLYPADYLFALHDYDFVINQNKQKAIFIEDDKMTYDLTSLIEAQIPCGLISDWEFENWQSRGNSSAVVFYSQGKATGSAQCTSDKVFVMSILIPLKNNGASFSSESSEINFKLNW
jgi:hypothetical protein